MSSNSINLGKAGVSIIETPIKPILGNVGDGLAILRGWNGDILEARSIVGVSGVLAVLDDAESQIELSLDAAKVREFAGTEDLYKDLLSLDQDLQSALTEINSVAVAGDILTDKLRVDLEHQIDLVRKDMDEDMGQAVAALDTHTEQLNVLADRTHELRRANEQLLVDVATANFNATHAERALREAEKYLKRAFMVANISLIISAAILAERLWSLIP